jgi:hypothetical protein
MLRRLTATAFVLAGLVFVSAPAAAGDGPGPYTMQGGEGVLSPDGSLRYLALAVGGGEWTSLQSIRTADGRGRAQADLSGAWGVSTMFGDGRWTSLSPDGRTLVLAQTIGNTNGQSSFLVYDPRTAKFRQSIVLEGNYTFDALSPEGRRLYLIQHVSVMNGSRYVVRAYDLRKERLLPGRIADRTQKGWVMQGYPVTRTTSSDGRMVYTLYDNPGGYAFVHALDTVRGVAHCVGLPLTSRDPIYDIALAVHGKSLAVRGHTRRLRYEIDTTTWRLSSAHDAFPWLWVALGCAVPLAGAGTLLVLLRRRRGGEEFEEELADLLRVPEREVVV